MLDAGRYFVVHTDDPDSLTPMGEKEIEKQLAVSKKELERRATLFELAKTVVLWPLIRESKKLKKQLSPLRSQSKRGSLSSFEKHSKKFRWIQRSSHGVF